MTMLQDPIHRIRTVGLIEGVSYLLLLGVAMPLKYAAGMPMAVEYVGWAHGVLFITLALVTFWALAQRAINFKTTCMVALASVLPFGPFVIDPKLKRLAPGGAAFTPPANPSER